MERPAAQDTGAPENRTDTAKMFNAFLTINPCSYDDLPAKYTSGILYGVKIAVFCGMSLLVRMFLYGGMLPLFSLEILEYFGYFTVFMLQIAATILLSALVSSALASFLFGRDWSPQAYALWIGVWTYIPLLILLPVISWCLSCGNVFMLCYYNIYLLPYAACFCILILCVLNTSLVSAFASLRRPFESQREHFFHNLYCFVALFVGYCLFIVSNKSVAIYFSLSIDKD